MADERRLRARARIGIAAGLLLAFALGLALQWPAVDGDRFWVSDRQKYPIIGYNLARHGAYYAKQDYAQRLARGEPIHPYLLRAPGYPFFLAAVFRASPHFDGIDPECLITDGCRGGTALRRDVQRASAIVAALLVPATAAVAGLWFGGWTAAVAAAVLMAFSIPNNDQSRLAALFLLGHAGFALLAYRARGQRRIALAVASGVLLAALILTRAIFQYWVVVLVVMGCAQFVLARRGRGDRGALSTATIAVVAVLGIAPWMARNHAVAGEYAVAVRRGYMLAIRAEYTEMSWPEVAGGLAYYLPLQPEAVKQARWWLMRRLEPEANGYRRFDRSYWKGFYRRAKRQNGVVAERAHADPDWQRGPVGQKGRDAALDRAARAVLLENWPKQLALSFVFGVRGAVVQIPRVDLTAYGSAGAAAGRWGTAFGQWAALFHWPAMIASIVILGVRRDWSRLYFFVPALFAFVIHAGATHYLPRYSDPLIPIWTVGLVFVVVEGMRALGRSRGGAAS